MDNSSYDPDNLPKNKNSHNLDAGLVLGSSQSAAPEVNPDSNLRRFFHKQGNDMDYIPVIKKTESLPVKEERPLEDILSTKQDGESLLAKWDKQVVRSKPQAVPEPAKEVIKEESQESDFTPSNNGWEVEAPPEAAPVPKVDGKENRSKYVENVLQDYKPDKFEDDWDEDGAETKPRPVKHKSVPQPQPRKRRPVAPNVPDEQFEDNWDD